MRKRRLKWFGHVCRTEKEDDICRMLNRKWRAREIEEKHVITCV